MNFVVIVAALVVGGVVGWYTPDVSLRTTGLKISQHRQGYAVSIAVLGAVVGWSLWEHLLLVPAWLAIAYIGGVLAIVDVQYRRLPDRLVLPLIGAVAVLLLLPAAVDGSWGFYLRGLLGLLVMSAAYFLLAVINPDGMGLGDVKLAAALGLALGFSGWTYVLVGFMCAFVLGALVSIALMVAGRATRKTKIPFGPFMVVGAILTLVIGRILTS